MWNSFNFWKRSNCWLTFTFTFSFLKYSRKCNTMCFCFFFFLLCSQVTVFFPCIVWCVVHIAHLVQVKNLPCLQIEICQSFILISTAIDVCRERRFSPFKFNWVIFIHTLKHNLRSRRQKREKNKIKESFGNGRHSINLENIPSDNFKWQNKQTLTS